MNDEPRHKLRELLIEHGRTLCADPRRCEALLKDYCGTSKREIFVLIAALKNRVADDLLKSSADMPQAMVMARLQQLLEDKFAMTSEAALWAVESWVYALGLVVTPSAPVASVAVVAPARLDKELTAHATRLIWPSLLRVPKPVPNAPHTKRLHTLQSKR